VALVLPRTRDANPRPSLEASPSIVSNGHLSDGFEKAEGELMRIGPASLALIGCVVVVVLGGCEGKPIRSSYGAYPEVPSSVVLASGDTLNVYRVKYWTFSDGGASALQLEYEAPLPIADTAGLRAFALQIWPQFRPYVDSLSLTGAILSATTIIRHRQMVGWRADFQHFGVLLDRDSTGVWSYHGQPVQYDEDAVPLMVFGSDGGAQPLLTGLPRNPQPGFEFRLNVGGEQVYVAR
jgi:hypothetical protein